jgi:hypothetical protein
MKPLTERAHGYLDYGTVLYLLLAPTLFGLYGRAAAVFYVLAFAHLSLTLATAYSLGVVRWMRFSTHGAVEGTVAFFLAIMPWILGYEDDQVARNVSVATAIGIGVVALLTDYRRVVRPAYERARDTPFAARDLVTTSSLPPSSIPVSTRLASPTPVPISEEGPPSAVPAAASQRFTAHPH